MSHCCTKQYDSDSRKRVSDEDGELSLDIRPSYHDLFPAESASHREV